MDHSRAKADALHPQSVDTFLFNGGNMSNNHIEPVANLKRGYKERKGLILIAPGLLLALIFLLAAETSAQVGLSNVHPNLARGSGSDKTTEKYDWDSINLFNGNLNISVPLGIKYPVARNFGYQLTLICNSNIWDIEQPSSVISASPMKHSNAGVGWDISLGRLLPPAVNGSQVGRWVYIDPDGAWHPFYSTLHYDLSENDPGDAALYTRDGSYYRMRYISTTSRIVEWPDGTRSFFDLVGAEWRLTKIADRFNNYLAISYGANTWSLSDNHGRLHTIYFKSDPAGYYPSIVDRAVLASFGGATATYTFSYSTIVATRPSVDTDPVTSATVNLPALASIALPDGSRYNFTYHPTGAGDASGRLASIQLPTLGKIEYSYRDYSFTSPECPTSLAPHYRKNTGVATRRMVDAAGSVSGTWSYSPKFSPGDASQQYNVALSSKGATAVASSLFDSRFPAISVINGDRRGLNWGNGGGWNDGTAGVYPDWIEVTFNGTKTISEINVFTLQDNYTNPLDPAPGQTFAVYGIVNFDVQYLDGAQWRLVSGGSVTGNNLVWRRFTFAPVTTNKIRVVVNSALQSYSRITEIEAFEYAGHEEQELSNTVQTPVGDKTVYYFSVNTLAGGPEWNRSDYGLPFTKKQFDRPRIPMTNVALAGSGATATASSILNGSYPASGAINGDHKGSNYGTGGVWMDGTTNWWPDWLEVSFAGSRTIDRINVFTLQDNYSNPSEPTIDMTFSLYGIQDFDVQCWNGATWVTVPDGNVKGNNKVWRQFTFPPVTTNRIRVVINKSLNLNSRIVEVEAFESALPADTRFLSRQVYDCDSAGNNCRLLRSTYVRYEQDEATDPAFADAGNTNRREASQRILYHDDVENGVERFADTDRSNFDGLGHYRRTVTGGNFGSGDVRESIINYDAATGTYPSAGYIAPAPSIAWLPNLYSQQKMIEGIYGQVTDFCYNRSTGFLNRVRRYYQFHTAPAPASNDVVIVYTPDAAGNTTIEQYYGGDTQAIGTNSLCALALPADQYQIRHSYQYGSRRSSQYHDAAGQPFGPRVLDDDIDLNTGLTRVSRNIAGIATVCEYDTSGRMTWMKPEAGHGAWTQHNYTMATGNSLATGAKTLIYKVPNGGGSPLTYYAEVQDSFGRLSWEQKSVPTSTGVSYPNRYKSYNALGWLTHQSEFSADAPRYTQYIDHDPIGRPRLVRPPDGPQHDITYEYVGVRSIKKIVSTARWHDTTTGQIIEAPRASSIIHDRQGRQWKTIRHVGTQTSTLDAVFVNTYDVVGRLLYTTRDFRQIGNRYDYDGRGFLFNLLDESGRSTAYKNLDPMGKSLKQRFSTVFLTFTYDRAARPVRVQDFNNPSKVYKEFFYSGSNTQGDWSQGKLQTAKRYNYLPNNPYPFVVTETYTYGGRGGRASKYAVALDDIYNRHEKYEQSYNYNELSQVEEITYPVGLTADSGSMGRERKVNYQHSQGLLTSVTGSRNDGGGWASESWANSILYHPNGLISQVAHANGVSDNVTTDANGILRVASFFTTGVRTFPGKPDQNYYSGDFVYDGAGLLAKAGGQAFIAPLGYQPPPPPPDTGYTSPCLSQWQDPFNLPIASGYYEDCTSTMHYFYTAGDRLLVQANYATNRRTWFFYDLSGALLTEYQRVSAGTTWISTRDYIYSERGRLATVERLPAAPFTRLTHYHIGYGSEGLTTDANGYRIQQ